MYSPGLIPASPMAGSAPVMELSITQEPSSSLCASSSEHVAGGGQIGKGRTRGHQGTASLLPTSCRGRAACPTPRVSTFCPLPLGSLCDNLAGESDGAAGALECGPPRRAAALARPACRPHTGVGWLMGASKLAEEKRQQAAALQSCAPDGRPCFAQELSHRLPRGRGLESGRGREYAAQTPGSARSG